MRAGYPCPAAAWRGRVLAFVDIDSQQKRVYGHAKQGAAFGFTKIQGKGLLVRGLNVLAASICTPLAAPVIASTRLRGGSASSARRPGRPPLRPDPPWTGHHTPSSHRPARPRHQPSQIPVTADGHTGLEAAHRFPGPPGSHDGVGCRMSDIRHVR